MPTLAEAAKGLIIPGIGHVFVNDVDAAEFSLANFKFGDESTYGTWKWIGDTSSENLIEFETDGGEVTIKRTWDRLSVRAIRAPENISCTINAVAISGDLLALAYPGGVLSPDGTKYTVTAGGDTSQRALLVVMEDGSYASGFKFYNTDIKGSFPSLDLEEFMEIPLATSILTSPSSNALWDILLPVAYAGPATP